MAVNIPAGYEVKPDGSIGPTDSSGFDAAFGGQPPAPVPQPPPIQTVNGTNINNTSQSPAPNAFQGAFNNIYAGSAEALAAAHRAANRGNTPVSPSIMKTVNSPMSLNFGLGPVGSANSNPDQPISYAPSPLPQATAQVPPGSPAPPMPLPRRQPQSAQPYSNPWDPQGVGMAETRRLAAQQMPTSGYAPNMNNAAIGDQIMGGGLFDGRAPVQGPLAALAPQGGPRFTQVSNMGGPLLSALDLSGHYTPTTGNARSATYVPDAVPPAPRSYNLGYGGSGGRGRSSAPPAYRAQTPVSGYDPFTHVWRDAPAYRAPVGQPIRNTWAPGASGIVQGRGGVELLNPGKPLW